jgi:SOS response regulatory protein OraA/RecX
MSRFKKKPEPTPPPRQDMTKVKAALQSTGYGSEEASKS